MITLFSGNKKGKGGLVGLTLYPDKAVLAHIVPGTDRPVLLTCSEHAVSTQEQLGRILKQAVNEQGLAHTRTNFVLSAKEYKLLLIEAPNVEPGELAGAVKWKIKDLVDQPVDDYALSVFPVPEDSYRSQNKMVYVAAARKNRIREIVELVTEAELRLEAIDIPELVMLNISLACADDADGLAFIDLRGSGSTLNLSKGGMIYLTRHLNTQVNSDVMATGEWETILERLVLEIQRSLDYYESQMGQGTIRRVLIAPRENDSRELVEELNKAMTVNVESLDITTGFETRIEMPLEFQQHCMMAIGGALRQELQLRREKAA